MSSFHLCTLMKPATPTPRSWLRIFHSCLLFPFGLLMAALPAKIRAENVDTELLLLVDISRPELSPQRFNRLMDAYADSFSSSQVLNSIQSGHYGKIAVAMMFFGGNTVQQMAVPWMSISNAQDAATFGQLATQAVQPVSLLNPNIANALAAASASFGSETGAPDNGFESVVQIVEVAAVRLPSGSPSQAAAASDSAIAAGVDVINAIAMGNFTAPIQAFYSSNVIGTTIPGMKVAVTTSLFNNGLGNLVGTGLNESVENGAVVSNASAVPEPASHLVLLSGLVLLFIRRRA